MTTDVQENNGYEVRARLIERLKSCDASTSLTELWQDYLKNKEIGLFNLSLLKSSEAVAIQSMNSQIDRLFVEKSELYSVKLTVVDKYDNSPDDELYSDDEIQEEAFAAINGIIKKIEGEDRDEDNSDVSSSSAASDANLLKEQHLVEVRRQIQLLRVKAESFRAKMQFCLNLNQYQATMYYKAHSSALNLAKSIETVANNYASDSLDLNSFKAQCRDLFSTDNHDIQVLHTHRGWKQLLVNVLAALIGGIFYMAAAVCTGRLLLFRPETNAEKRVNHLAEAIDNVYETNVY
jgi:hypothetical protein